MTHNDSNTEILIGRIRNMIIRDLPVREIVKRLVGENSVEQIYLAYQAASILEKYSDSVDPDPTRKTRIDKPNKV